MQLLSMSPLRLIGKGTNGRDIVACSKKMHKLKKYTTEITEVSSKKNTNEHLKLLRFMWIT